MERVKCLERLQMAEGFLYSRLDVCRGPGIARYFKVKSGGRVCQCVTCHVRLELVGRVDRDLADLAPDVPCGLPRPELGSVLP